VLSFIRKCCLLWFSSSNGVGKTPQCNLMSFVTSLIFNPSNATQPFPENIYGILELASKYQSTYRQQDWYQQLTSDAYVASFVTALGLTGNEYPDMFAFCGYKCSAISVVTSDSYNYATSEYYYQLTNGSCTDSIFSSTNW
jgi:hypothetical protein